MQIAIVGLTGSGKTTVFNTLTRGHAETGGYGGVTMNVGVVKVPDERLERLAEIFKPKKVIHADVTYVDLPAPPPSTEGHVGTEEHTDPLQHREGERDRAVPGRQEVYEQRRRRALARRRERHQRDQAAGGEHEDDDRQQGHERECALRADEHAERIRRHRGGRRAEDLREEQPVV